MSIDFTTIKGWEIPEGKVAKVADAGGLILWTAVKMVNLTITSFWDGMDGDSARITINSPSPFAPNPNEPNNKVTSWTAYVYDLFDQQNRTIKIPVGSTIECYITRDKGNADSYIKLNGVSVATGEGTYVYTVTGDATIDVSEDYVQGDFGVISITGAVTYISFTINGETYQSIEGMVWNGWFASSYNTTGKTKGDVESIKDANGNDVSIDAVIVGGTAYAVEFSSEATVKISGSATTSSYFSITIEGQTFDGNADVELIVQTGTKIEFTVQSNYYYSSKIVIGESVFMGTTVASAVKGEGNVTKYTYEVLGDVTIKCSTEIVSGICVLITEA